MHRQWRNTPQDHTEEGKQGILICLLSVFTLRVLVRAADDQLSIPESIYRVLGMMLDAAGKQR